MLNTTKTYALDGELIDLETFLDDNRDGPDLGDADVIAAIRAMEPGEEIVFGGGAAPVFVLRCVSMTLSTHLPSRTLPCGCGRADVELGMGHYDTCTLHNTGRALS